MMHVLLAKSFGFSKIFCMDLNDFRLDFVKKFDVTTIRSDDPNLVQKVTDDTTIGVDVAIVASSSLCIPRCNQTCKKRWNCCNVWCT